MLPTAYFYILSIFSGKAKLSSKFYRSFRVTKGRLHPPLEGSLVKAEALPQSVGALCSLLLRLEENSFALLRAKGPKPLYQPMRRGQSDLLRMPKYRPLPVRFGLTLFPGAVQYAHAVKRSSGRVHMGHCLYWELWYCPWGRILQGAPPPLVLPAAFGSDPALVRKVVWEKGV